MAILWSGDTIQLQVGMGDVDVETKTAVWGSDDLWRVIWMTIIFGALFPLSRSTWALRKNFSLAMWLHLVSSTAFAKQFRELEVDTNSNRVDQPRKVGVREERKQTAVTIKCSKPEMTGYLPSKAFHF